MSELLREVSRGFLRDISARTREFFELISPPIDMVEDGSDLVVAVDLPGFKRENIHVRAAGSTLTVVAEREPLEYSGMDYWKQRPLKINRKIPLPIRIPEETEVTGKYENGVLTLRIPLAGVAKVKID